MDDLGTMAADEPVSVAVNERATEAVDELEDKGAAHKLVTNVKGSTHKKFDTIEEAEHFLMGHAQSSVVFQIMVTSDWNSAAVMMSCTQRTTVRDALTYLCVGQQVPVSFNPRAVWSSRSSRSELSGEMTLSQQGVRQNDVVTFYVRGAILGAGTIGETH